MSSVLNKKFRTRKLVYNLLIANIFFLIISMLLAFGLSEVFGSIINTIFIKTSFIDQKKQEVLEEFKSYIKEDDISLYEFDKFDKWTKEHKYLEVYIFKDNILIYDSAYRNNDGLFKEIIDETNISSYFNSVSFLHEDAEVYMDYYIEYYYYYIVTFISILISIIFFNLVMFTLITKKINYIKTIENEIKILEGGNLSYEITKKGNDELTSLAQSINEMRKSFIEMLQNEDEATSANSELITAISHDLRTPLTALVGYLDIIEYKKYKTEEDLMIYIHNSREKAYQIKHMSDKLFEYFLVFNNQSEIELETYNGNELLEQLIQEHFFQLSNKGFKFNLEHCTKVFFFDVNLIGIRRVFDNIFSNISKYADNSKSIEVNYHAEEDSLIINIENDLKSDLKSASSNGIGLKTCKKIVEMHNGQLLYFSKDKHFKMTIILPIHYN